MAMQDEYGALIKIRTWDLLPRPPGVNIVNCMWLFKHKYKSNGDLERQKARLVCDGRSEEVGVDCGETFSPVVKPATICMETVYLHQPPGFVDRRAPSYGDDMAYLLLYVDDIILATSSFDRLRIGIIS
ncbi:uncharacterized protein LOC110685660 [Chenopodium quinoa]|uniref:uncharacterized protein LOC110685660 n=1 Tax=Chenopodium quinoa TaxID=63459 RepID=UPI000B78F836|nr:uncharacterized protein LOC110685660 [Chenopodium quinoa]